MTEFEGLLANITACTLCQAQLPFEPKPILQVHPKAKILIAGQAPGQRAHEAGIPFDDPSGKRLRQWLGLSKQEFYDPELIAIVPMGFCFPGTGRSGDLPPRPECASMWREALLSKLSNIELTIVLGVHAQRYHLDSKHETVTKLVQAWHSNPSDIVPLPHPSPRNNRWLANNPWFEQELIPVLRQRVATLISK